MTRGGDSALAAIVLAGGRSSRMGRPKALLDWHGCPLVVRVAGLLARVARPVVVVHAAGQGLPELPPGVERTEDRSPARGPLEGIATGLAALAERADAAYVSATDAPFLHPAFVLALAAALDGPGAVAAADAGRAEPLAACYGRDALPAARRLLDAGERRATALLERLDARLVPAQELPHPETLRNLNGPADLRAALALPEPAVVVERDGETRTVRAATLGRLLDALAAGSPPRLLLNGEPVGPHPQLPLVAGDRIAIQMS